MSKQKKPRNWHALNAIQRKAGAHKGSKAEQNKKTCRDYFMLTEEEIHEMIFCCQDNELDEQETEAYVREFLKDLITK